MALALLLGPAAAGASEAASGPRRPLRLLADEYHHFARPEGVSQGFSLDREEYSRTYFYSTDSTAHPNGLFLLAQAIGADFRAEISTEPIGPELLDRADAYMLICPETVEAGNPHPITPSDAEHLERFVAAGGILILVQNSVDSTKESFDRKNMNLIAGKFGIEFLAASTRIMLIPVRRDHPVFSGVRSYLYGGGTTIGLAPEVGPRATVLLESINPEVPGVVAVRVRHGRGAVLALGDAGSLGNPDVVRGNIDQFEAVRQMFHCLLPDGPMPAYAWKEGLRVRVKLTHELATAGYPEKLRLFDLPLDPAAKVTLIQPRALDLQAAGPSAAQDDQAREATTKARRHRFALARASWQIECRLEIGEHDGRAHAARWIGPDRRELTCRLTPRGEVLDASPGEGALAAWRWALVREVIMSPLDPSARSSDSWETPVLTPLPHAQLHPEPILRAGTGKFRFEGLELCRGRSCFVFSKRVRIGLDGVKPQDFVDPSYADYFSEATVRFRDGGQVCTVRSWIDGDTRLPVRTELQASTGMLWTDRSQEDSFMSTHDWVTHEHRTEHVLYGTIGRRLVADFDY